MHRKNAENGTGIMNIDWSNVNQMLAVDLLGKLLRYLPSDHLKEIYPQHIFLKCNFGSPLVVLTHDLDFYIERERLVDKLVEKIRYLTGTRYLSMVKRYLEAERMYNCKSTIFILQADPVPLHFKVARMLGRLLPPGYDVGIHPAPHQTETINILELRKRLEMALNSNVRVARAHLLKWKGRSFIESLVKAGIVADSTFGYNNAIGYRGGIGTAFKPYGLDVLEIPLVLMDVALFRDLQIDLKKAVKLLNNFFDSIKEKDVVFAVNWHIDYAFNEDYMRLYTLILRKLEEIDAIIATMSEAESLIERHCKTL